MKVNLEKIGLSVLTLFGASLMTLIIIAISNKHDVDYYYLSTGDCGRLYVKGNVNWAADKTISLDRAVSYEDAIEMVSKLNKTLK